MESITVEAKERETGTESLQDSVDKKARQLERERVAAEKAAEELVSCMCMLHPCAAWAC